MQSVPVEFLSDQEAAAFGRYGGSVPLADLERFFYLDDADRKLVAGQREDHNRLGFSVQLATVRYIGRFLADPLEGVPAEVIDFLAGQLKIADPSCLKRYALRKPTHREHAGKIQERLGLKDFAEVEAELAVFAGRRAWVTGDGPKAIFADAVGWLRDRDVLLPGVSRLARLVARERDAATQRLWETLYAALAIPWKCGHFLLADSCNFASSSDYRTPVHLRLLASVCAPGTSRRTRRARSGGRRGLPVFPA